MRNYGLLLFIANSLNSFFGFLFQISMGRFLHNQEFAIVGAAFSLISIILTPLSSLGMLISRELAKISAIEPIEKQNDFINATKVAVYILASIVCITLLLFRNFIPNILNFDGTQIGYLFILLTIVTIPHITNNSILQGMVKFVELGISGTVSTLIKLICALILMSAGYGIDGVLLASILAGIWGAYYSNKNARIFSTSSVSNVSLDPILSVLRFKNILPVLFANIAFAIIGGVDIVLVNFYFDSNAASEYNAAAVIAKSVMYLPGGFALAMYPLAAREFAIKNDPRKKFLETFYLAALIAISFACIISVYSESIILFLYGDRYLMASELLGVLTFALLPLGLVVLCEQYLLSKNVIFVTYILMAIIPIEIIAFYFLKSSLLNIIKIMLLFNWIFLIFSLAATQNKKL